MSLTYVFCDLATGSELAQLPMTGVSFEQKFLDVGVLTGVIPTVDPAVRALDPWAASAERRTFLVVEEDDTPVWAGIVYGREWSQDTYGIKVTAATFEAWLNYAFLRADANFVGAQTGAPSTISALLAQVQSYPAGSIGLTVGSNQYPWTIGQGGDGTGEARVGGQVYAATELKPLQDVLLNWLPNWGVPIEWRVDLSKRPTGGYNKTLLVSEVGLDEGRDTVLLTYPGNLLTFTDRVDGTAHATAVVGAASGSDAAGNTIKKFSFTTADAVGVPELAAGYPLQTTAYSVPSADTTAAAPLTQAQVDAAVQAEQLDRLSQGQTLSNVTIAPGRPRLSGYAVGDPLRIEITHPGYREWPGETVYDGYRIVGRQVTVGEGSTPTSVTLTVVPGGDRIPNYRTVSAEIRAMASRIKMLETRSGM